jgi:hypothetical protein
MTQLDLLSHGLQRVIIGFRQVKNLLAQIAFEVLLLHPQQDLMKLKCNLSGPRACLWVHREQVTEELSGLVMTSTCQASVAQCLQNHLVCPQAFKIPGCQDFCHTLCQCIIMQVRQLGGHSVSLKLGWHQELHVTVSHHHCHLTQWCANVGKSNFMGLGVADAPSRGHHHLQQVPQHRL